MAKFAVLVLAAFAFQAAFAGVVRPQYQQENALGDFEYGKLEGFQGLFSKYQGFGKYGQSGKEYVMEIQTIAQELAQCLQTISVDDVQAKHTLMYLIREYAQELEAIVERLEQVSYQTETDVYDFQQFAQYLRQMVVSFQRLYNVETMSVMELRTQFHLYVQRTVQEFEKFYYGVQSYKQTGAYYTIVQSVLEHFLYATRTLVFHVQHIAEGQYTREYTPFAQYGQGYGYSKYYGQQYGFGKYGQGNQYNKYAQYYGGLEGRQYTPMQLVAKIEYVAKDLSATLQQSMVNGEQAAQIISVQARHFTQTIKAIVNQLEEQLTNEHVEVIQQVIYKLREVYAHFEKLVAYKTFTNIHQLKAEFDQHIQIAVAQFEKLAYLAQEETQGHYYYVIKNVLNMFFYGLQDFHYQIQEVAYTGEFAQYNKGYGYGKYYGQQYGFGKYGQGNQYNKYAQYYAGLEGHQYTPKQLVAEIEYVAKDLSATLQQSMLEGEQAMQYLTMQVRQFAMTIKTIVNQFEGQLNNDYEHFEIVQQVIYKLRAVYMHLEQQVTYKTFSNIHQLRAEFDKYIHIVIAQFERLVVIAQLEQTEGNYYYVIKNVLNFFLNGLQDFHYQIQEFTQYGYAGQYNAQYNREFNGQYGYGKYYGQYFGGLEGRQYTPRQLVAKIEYVSKDLSETLENSMLTGQKAVQVLSVQARQFAQIMKNIVMQLEGQLTNDFEHVELFQQVVYKLREVQLAFEKLAAYNVFTNVHQMRAEFDKYIHIAMTQFERLVVIAQEETQGNYYYVIKNVLNMFFYGLQDFHYQIQEFAYNGQYAQYGQQYGFNKYGQGYGYGKQYYGLRFQNTKDLAFGDSYIQYFRNAIRGY